MTTVAQDLAALLKPMLPASYRFVTSERKPDALSVPTVFVRLRSIDPAPNITAGANLLNFVVSIAQPRAEFTDRQEEELEEAVLRLLAALDELPAYLWSSAEKALYGDQPQYPVWDINLTITIRKD